MSMLERTSRENYVCAGECIQLMQHFGMGRRHFGKLKPHSSTAFNNVFCKFSALKRLMSHSKTNRSRFILDNLWTLQVLANFRI